MCIRRNPPPQQQQQQQQQQHSLSALAPRSQRTTNAQNRPRPPGSPTAAAPSCTVDPSAERGSGARDRRSQARMRTDRMRAFGQKDAFTLRMPTAHPVFGVLQR
ncbi:hypothetical protein BU26DRAFT_562319 [Trematosphaeria pertusa]|uniref:Uncharacterized protein n=1 Tax=Trematosphaeria pertusa TaxID=390896 RepID=A0A6A6IQB6_9PLEO|nr:uncharacterized protein BU26DRAFT_562319 [Trematosphaeria pertusa]KAF2252586.1 hypothetical protein BU26DRAFT_562319 [Trematosphaeria pertusa]